jgi:ankyrin repeat protein
MNNHLPVVAILLDHHASVDLANACGNTPLHLASYGGHTDVMRHLLAAGASRDIADANWNAPLELAEMCDQTAAMELLTEWPKNLTPIMNAVAMRNGVQLQGLLQSGEDPHVTVQHKQLPLNALTLATMEETAACWAAPVCAQTLKLIQSSLQWTPEGHYLFPPSFRRGVKHLLGAKVALDTDDDREFPEPIWMMIISFLPRDWDFN